MSCERSGSGSRAVWAAPFAGLLAVAGCSGPGHDSGHRSTEPCPPFALADVPVLPPGDFDIVTADRPEIFDEGARRAGLDSIPPTFVFVPLDSPDDGDDRSELAVVLTAEIQDEVDQDLENRSPEAVVVAGVDFERIVEGVGQATYSGEIDGEGVGISTLRIDEPTLESFVGALDVMDRSVSFDGAEVPPGWISLGTFEHRLSFLLGATGGNAPACGLRVGFDAREISESDRMSSVGDFEVAVSVWPVASPNPSDTARYSLDGERRIAVDLGDGRSAVGYANDPDVEFFEYVMWVDDGRWTAVSVAGPVAGFDVEVLPALLTPPTPEDVAKMTDLLGE